MLLTVNHLLASDVWSLVESQSESVLSSQYDFAVHLVNDEGEMESHVVNVHQGQRIADAADDFARRHDVLLDNIFDVDMFDMLCEVDEEQLSTQLSWYKSDPPTPPPVIVECESSESNSVISHLVMSEVRDLSPLEEVVVTMSIYVRKGYSATQQALFACAYYGCSDAMYRRVYDRISKTMDAVALDIFYHEPFALTEGPTLSHLLTYCLSKLQDDVEAQEYCADVSSMCEIDVFCPKNGEVMRMKLFCEFLYEKNNTGTDFFRRFQSAYTVPETKLVPTPEILKGARLFAMVMIMNSKHMVMDNDVCRLLVIVVSSYVRESFSPYATESTVKRDFIGKSKLSFHTSQMEYLLKLAKSKKLIINPKSSRPELRTHAALKSYFSRIVRNLKKVVEPLSVLPYSHVVAPNKDTTRLMADALYNRNIYHRPFFPEGSGHRLMSLPKVNPLPDEEVARITEQYIEQNVVVVDNFLNLEVLEEIYKYCVESTIWHESTKALFVGSYWEEGLSHPLLIDVAKEIARIFPFVGELPLVNIWAYNFDPAKADYHRGIGHHMDSAVVNLNLWLTPDEANLDHDSGGLVVFLKHMLDSKNNPLKKKFPFDRVQDPEFGKEFLRGSEHLNVTVPYKRNRVVIFDSALWHTTDDFNFAPGHENRRINLTFLFGQNRYIDTSH